MAEKLNFTAAAREQNVSQPALSQRIRQLEEELGVRLFLRTSHQVMLTRAGELVVDHARRTLESAQRLRDEVDAFRGVKRGTLRIGVTQSFNALHMAPVLADFLQQHPQVDVTVLEWANTAIIAGVEDGALDLGIAFGPIGGTSIAEALYTDRLMLACPPAHPCAAMERVPLSALADETLALLTPEFGTRRDLDAYFAANDLSPARIVAFNTFASILKLIETGQACSLVPGWQARGDTAPASVCFRDLDPAPPERTMQLILPTVQAQSPAAVRCADILRGRFL